MFCSIYICLDVLRGGVEKHWIIIGFHAFFHEENLLWPPSHSGGYLTDS